MKERKSQKIRFDSFFTFIQKVSKSRYNSKIINYPSFCKFIFYNIYQINCQLMYLKKYHFLYF